MYSLKDVAVVIATYNRPADMLTTLESFKDKINLLSELVVIDQSTNEHTKKLVKKFKSKKVKYFHSNIPSLTAARNTGIGKLSFRSRICIFIDDDVTLDKNYFDGILEVFNKYPEAKATGGYFLPKIKINKFEMSLKKLFLIENMCPNDAKVYSPYGAAYPSKLTRIIQSEWIPGFNMAFKKEVFQKDKFDENFFRYGLGEDFEFTTRLNKKYPKSMFITPYAGITHRVSTQERMPKPKLAYMNHVNHLYIQKKNFNTVKGIISTIIALLVISLMHISLTTLKLGEKNKIKLKLHFKSILYCFKRLNLIRRGNLEIPFN